MDVHVNMRVVDTPPVRSEAWGRLQVVKRNLRTVTAVVDRLDVRLVYLLRSDSSIALEKLFLGSKYNS